MPIQKGDGRGYRTHSPFREKTGKRNTAASTGASASSSGPREYLEVFTYNQLNTSNNERTFLHNLGQWAVHITVYRQGEGQRKYRVPDNEWEVAEVGRDSSGNYWTRIRFHSPFSGYIYISR